MKQTKLWKTKDGRKIRICDMEDNHLLNTIAMLQRVSESRRISNSVYYLFCTPPNGEMALYAFEQEQDNVWRATWCDYLPPIYSNLVLEAERRGLTIPTQQERMDIEAKLINDRLGK